MNPRTMAWAAAMALALPLAIAASASARADRIVVENAWSRASIGTGRPGAAYMEIRNVSEEPVGLIGLETDLAENAQIHRTSMSADGVSSMASAGEVEIAPGATVALEPGGLHAMLMRLKRPMNRGESFVLMILLSDGDGVAVEVPILGIAARGPQD